MVCSCVHYCGHSISIYCGCTYMRHYEYDRRVASTYLYDRTASSVREVYQETSGQRNFFVDGKKVGNPKDPIANWKISTKASKVPGGAKFMALWPESSGAAQALLKSRDCSLILLSDNAFKHYGFNGWVQFKEVAGSWTARYYMARSKEKELQGFEAAFLQSPGDDDVVKFNRDCPEPYIVILDPSWVSSIASSLNAKAWY